MTSFHSQHGEDELLARIFPGPVGTCIEVGANDGVTFSNSLHFERRGWTCVLVEPTPHLCESIRRQRNALLFECAASGREGETVLHVAEGLELYSSLEENSTMADAIHRQGATVRDVRVKMRPLDDMLADAGITSVEFLTIDVEGHELEVLKGFTLERWKPRILIVEDSTDLEDTPVLHHLHQVGYRRFYRSGGNDWYAAPNERHLRNLPLLLTQRQWKLPGLLKAWLPAPARRAVVGIKRRFRFS